MTESFQLFGTVHLWTIIALVVIGIILIFPTRKYASEKQKRVIGIYIGLFMLIQKFIDRYYEIFILNEPILDNLPLHFCGISVIFVAILLINRNFKIFEIVYFWGLAGATISLLTPDVPYAFPHVLNITFFLSHGLIIIGVLYMIFVFNYRPTIKSFIKSYIVTQAYIILMGTINYFLDTNYLFLCHKPDAATPLDYMGSWPWYIVSAQIVLIIIWVILYAPYFLIDIRNKKS